MLMTAILALVTTAAAPTCSWDHPGHNPYMGDVVGAVDRYTDIAPEVRARLKARMTNRDYDDMVSIRRDAISGNREYDPAIRDMHFGTGSVCRTVTRASWAPQDNERGLVYCEAEQCILVPTVCRNVSRITRTPIAGPVLAAAAPPVAAAPVAAAPAPAGTGELLFPPPAAGAAPTEPSFASRSAMSTPGSVAGAFEGPGSVPTAAYPQFSPIPGGLGAVPNVPTSPVPEPSSAILFLTGAGVGLIWRLVRRPAGRRSAA